MKIIVANWKMNPQTAKEAQTLARSLNKTVLKQKVVLCPPDLYLPLIKSKFDLGAQNVFWQESGAHTGEISPDMLAQFGVKYVIIGHSERRENGEADEQINKKILACLKHKLIPILCVGFGVRSGETDEEVMSDLRHQLEADLKGVEPSKVIVAYEPVWAIGSGKPATPEHAEKIAMFIKIKFKVKKVLYGGSTNYSNAKSFLKKSIDGLLVGGASLKAEEFSAMIK